MTERAKPPRKNIYGDGNLLRCLASNLIYYPPDYKPDADCGGCDQEDKCRRIRRALTGSGAEVTP